jgi:hypothetical protein
MNYQLAGGCAATQTRKRTRIVAAFAMGSERNHHRDLEAPSTAHAPDRRRHRHRPRGRALPNGNADQTRGAWRGAASPHADASARDLRTAQRWLLLFSVFWSFVFGAAAGGVDAFSPRRRRMMPPVAFIRWII